MRHAIEQRGFAFRLRPVGLEDARLIVELRRDPRHTRFLHPIDTDETVQRNYLERYFERADDYYFVIERLGNGQPEGLIAIYDVKGNLSAEWGRWVLRPGSLAAVESAWLIYQTAFARLGLNEIYCRTIKDNERVVSFHDSCGVARREIIPAHFQLDCVRYDAVEHALPRADWPVVAARLETPAQRLAARLGGECVWTPQ